MPDSVKNGGPPQCLEDQAKDHLAAIGAMVPDLAHKIGTPLNIILANAELLESSLRDERGGARLASIYDQIERITLIIRSFLEIARPDEPCFTSNSIQQVIEDSLLIASEQLEQQQVQVSTVFAPLPAISCDANQLKELFTKLFSNAADAIAQEGGELHLSLESEDENLLIKIQDNGEGIHENDLPKIFEAFFSTKPSGRGCGLGLVSARQIATVHGGSIQVESEFGKGTTFFVRLPLHGVGNLS